MSSQASADRDRLLELLSDRALFGLSEAEQKELQELQVQFPETRDDEMDAIVALLEVSSPSHRSGVDQEAPAGALPERLLSKVRLDAGLAGPNRAPVGGEFPHASAAGSGRRWMSGVLAVAGALVLAAFAWYASQPNLAATLEAQRQQLITGNPDVIVASWKATDAESQIVGDVVWSPSLQRGFMKFSGLKINDPSIQQYQLWIFDSEQDARYPIDGGVFDVGAESAIVPIHAKLAVADPTMFAVTIEKPGGVVVSDRSQLPLIAEVN